MFLPNVTTYQLTQHSVPEEKNHHQHSSESLKSHKYFHIPVINLLIRLKYVMSNPISPIKSLALKIKPEFKSLAVDVFRSITYYSDNTKLCSQNIHTEVLSIKLLSFSGLNCSSFAYLVNSFFQ
jgi:hypothetical protein